MMLIIKLPLHEGLEEFSKYSGICLCLWCVILRRKMTLKRYFKVEEIEIHCLTKENRNEGFQGRKLKWNLSFYSPNNGITIGIIISGKFNSVTTLSAQENWNFCHFEF